MSNVKLVVVFTLVSCTWCWCSQSQSNNNLWYFLLFHLPLLNLCIVLAHLHLPSGLHALAYRQHPRSQCWWCKRDRSPLTDDNTRRTKREAKDDSNWQQQIQRIWIHFMVSHLSHVCSVSPSSAIYGSLAMDFGVICYWMGLHFAYPTSLHQHQDAEFCL